ncbi:fluoride ion transporter CrcB [Pseudomonas citronellolis]|uniref:Fluoride-specific ion channel FluC n=1 Tax=Pseudomonas citronellolis TaxID=53408 RepID=A0A1A9KJ73_9PSED|nr:CrcB family protein [Pseudomonas citronellolis]ANI17529.1 fluoride ion transporter CrcB [Pseudomonas citronellolis]
MLKSIPSIACAASLGALLRWLLGLQLNALFPTILPGTWAANPTLSPEWRLLIITGFCGGLTTFLTFSAETMALLQTGRVSWAMAAIGVHVAGSLLATTAGLITYPLLSGR